MSHNNQPLKGVNSRAGPLMYLIRTCKISGIQLLKTVTVFYCQLASIGSRKNQ